jgi:hypothetical protein
MPPDRPQQRGSPRRWATNTALPIPTGKDITDYVVVHGGNLLAWWEAATQPVGEPTAVAVGMARALNQFGGKGDGLVWYGICAGRAHGTISTASGPIEVTLDKVEASLQEEGMHIPRKTLKRYMKGCGTILHPKGDPNTGCDFVLLPVEEIKTALRKQALVRFTETNFPVQAQEGVDLVTGETRVMPPIIAHLTTQALEDAGFSPAEAAEAATLLQDQPLDEKTQHRCKGAAARVRREYDIFCEILADDRVIPLPPEMSITKAGDLKRAEARAWHTAQIPYFQTVSEQMQALGFGSKHTLYVVLEDIGIETEKVIEIVEVKPGDVKKQVQGTMKALKGVPRAYRVVTQEGETYHDRYRLTDIEVALKVGNHVDVEYQCRNQYRVGELPPPEERARRRKSHRTRMIRHRRIVFNKAPNEGASVGKHSELWVLGQLLLRYTLKFKGWPPHIASLQELVEAIVGRPLNEQNN